MEIGGNLPLMRAKNGKRNFNWYRLDNAATIMPSTTRGPDTRCFRITCTLREAVDPNILQHALDRVMEEFPHLQTVLRKGLFWYYFDETQEKPVVEEDRGGICRALYVPGRRSLLFRVLYAGSQISLEMYHAIADGTGGLMILKSLVLHYLSEKHGISLEQAVEGDASAAQKSDDAFARYYQKGSDPKVHNFDPADAGKAARHPKEQPSRKKHRRQWAQFALQKAYQIPMEKDFSLQCHYLEATAKTSEVRALAAKNKTTIGVFVVSVFIQSLIETMRAGAARHPIVISVPVNLRQYFPSRTARNFFGVISVAYRPGDYDGTLESILRPVAQQFSEQLTREAIDKTMNGYSGLVHNLAIQAVPLFLKDIGLSRITLLTRRGTTAVVSNLGAVRLPEEAAPFVDRFSAYMTAPRLQMCISSFGEKMVFGVVTAYDEKALLPAFFRKFTGAGLSLEIGSSDFDA